MATNSNNKNAKSRMVVSLWGSYWAHLGCWISPCYSLCLLGGRFETYELLISLIFQIFSCRSKLWITETMDTESADMGVRLYKERWDRGRRIERTKEGSKKGGKGEETQGKKKWRRE